jgi:hypothetical protein
MPMYRIRRQRLVIEVAETIIEADDEAEALALAREDICFVYGLEGISSDEAFPLWPASYRLLGGDGP